MSWLSVPIRIIVVLSLVSLSSFSWAAERDQSELQKMRQERQKLAHRRRRIIFNNDGDDLLGAPMFKKPVLTPEELLKVRTTALLGSQVDAIWYYSGAPKLLFEDGAFAQLYGIPEGTKYMRAAKEFLSRNGKGPLDVMIDVCRTHNLEIFYSNRMNDTHDSFFPELLYNIKKTHPEFTVSTHKEGSRYHHPDVRSFWAAWDFEHPEIRSLTVRALTQVCQTYDIDGIELDFLRHPVYFRETLQGKAVTKRHVDLITDMVRKIRRMTEEEGLRRGRPILLAAVCEGDLKLSLSVGLDIETWLKEGLIDILSIGRFVSSTLPLKPLFHLGHRYHVPAYPRVAKSGYKEIGQRGSDAMVYRGDAMVRFAEGADGIYMFNMFNPHDRLWWELGDPVQLAAMDKAYVWDFSPSWRSHSDLLWDLRSRGRRPPITITDQAGEAIPLMVGEDLAHPTPVAKKRTLNLRIHVTGLTARDKLVVKVNGEPLGRMKASEPLTDRPHDVWLEVNPKAGVFRSGKNLVQLTRTKPTEKAIKVDDMRLEVHYH